MTYMILTESTFDTQTYSDQEGKNLYLVGAFMRAETVNGNGRIYPKNVLEPEVRKINDKINSGVSVLGELDHSNELEIKLERVSHTIENLWWEGNEVHGKARILESTPNGNILKGLVESGVKVGVSSRASGSIDESNGKVASLNIISPADVVSDPSFRTYPTSIREAIELYNNEKVLTDLADAVRHDKKAQKYFQKEINKFIDEMFN